MESPPSSSTWSDAFVLSDDSGMLLTTSSTSSGSMKSRHLRRFEFQDSDCEDKSFSQDSLDGMSDAMCGENFNTLKKGPHWPELALQIAPPLQFRDQPLLDAFSACLAAQVLSRAIGEFRDGEARRARALGLFRRPSHHLGRPFYAPDFGAFSPCHGCRPGSRSSLGSSRLSSSHNSLSVPAAHRVDDSSFITQAVSHDTLSAHQISDLYNVPFDSDVYAVPVDVLRPPPKPKRREAGAKRRRRSTAVGCREAEGRPGRMPPTKKGTIKSERYHWCLQKENKRHSVAGTSVPAEGEPIHMTLQEVRTYLQTLYSSSSDSSEKMRENTANRRKPSLIVRYSSEGKHPLPPPNNQQTAPNETPQINKNNSTIIVANRTKKGNGTFLINLKNKKVKDSCDNGVAVGKQIASALKADNKRISNGVCNNNNNKKSSAKLYTFKQALCNMFRFKRFLSPEHDVKACDAGNEEKGAYINGAALSENGAKSISSRALPPLPLKEAIVEEETEQTLDFATSIQRVKDYGWYWGPLPSEMAEKILSNEPDGSFIVRDSSDDHYIFSLTFKLNNCVRHVRIDHDQGNFSFGSCTKFKSQTIVEFIENAVEHSRSGRYLFFLHRRPVIGPVRVQLLHPVSRFKQVQSLQHICRFVIHKVVRRDLIPSLPLPRRMIDYLNTPHYYSEHLIDVEDANNESVSSRNPTPAIRRDYDSNGEVNEEIVEHLQAQVQPDDRIVPLNNYYVLENNNNTPRQY